MTGADPARDLGERGLVRADATAVEIGTEVLLHVDPGIVRVGQRGRVDGLLGDVLDPCAELVLIVSNHLEPHAREVPAAARSMCRVTYPGRMFRGVPVTRSS